MTSSFPRTSLRPIKEGVVSLEILTAQKLGLKGTRLTEVLMRFVRATLYNKLSYARILIGSHL